MRELTFNEINMISGAGTGSEAYNAGYEMGRATYKSIALVALGIGLWIAFDAL